MARLISSLKLRQIADLTLQMVTNAKIMNAPVDVDLIAKYCGVAIEETDLGTDVSGLLVVQGDTAVIAYNPDQSDKRRRFTIAHELGHFALHRDSKNETIFVDKDFIVKYRSNKSYSEVEIRQEQEANAFAAALLMPKEFIFNELSNDTMRNLSESQLIEELAAKFNVSVPAMTFRLTNLNILY
jgi:Zn-dependent peptidase ImmA (M78 family)